MVQPDHVVESAELEAILARFGAEAVVRAVCAMAGEGATPPPGERDLPT